MDSVEEDKARTGSRMGEQIESATAEVGALVRAHPVGAIAVAAGIGYALGGGLFTRATSRLLGTALRLGVRFALLPIIERELSDLASASLAGGESEGGGGAGGERTHH